MKLIFPKSVLIIVDVQNDFCPGGSLAVKDGGRIVPALNSLSFFFAANSGKVVATQDWHPQGHVSFASSHEGKKAGETIGLPEVKSQVLWPVHCVQGSSGAAFQKDLDLKPVNLVIRKGSRVHLDSYSAFFENDKKTPTGLDGYLKSLSIDTVILGGLATDYCVLYSALDAAALGYKTIVARDAAAGVNYPEGSVDKAFMTLASAGVTIAETGDIIG